MQFLSLVGELRSQIHTVGHLSRCTTAREARVLQWTPSAVKIKPTSQTKTCKLLDGLMHQGEVNKVEKRMRPKGAADNFHHFARGGLSDEGDIWMEMRKWGRRVFQGTAFWAAGTACAKALGWEWTWHIRQQKEAQCGWAAWATWRVGADEVREAGGATRRSGFCLKTTFLLSTDHSLHFPLHIPQWIPAKPRTLLKSRAALPWLLTPPDTCLCLECPFSPTSF